MRTKFKHPPVNELVIGVYFKQPILPLKAEHIGLYWSRIRSEFPKSAQNVMIGNVDIPVPGEMFPLPRFWFISKDDVHLIQIQRNAFLFNWRKRDKEYPHFEQLKKSFDIHLVDFRDFLLEVLRFELPAIERCELTYINVVEPGEYFESIADVSKIIPSYSPPKLTKSGEGPSDFNLNYVYADENSLSLAVAIQSRLDGKSGKKVLYFEIRTNGALADGTKSEADNWFSKAHDVTGDVFKNLTNQDVQRQHWVVMED